MSILPPHICERIDKWIERYPKEHQRSGIFEALRLVQEHNNGYLTTELMNAVGDYLSMAHIAVYEVATFYTMFYLEPVGHHVIDVCTNVSCMLNGSEEILDRCRQDLKINVNETTADGKFTLKEVECLGACVAAPVCQIGKKYHESLTPDKMSEIINDLRRDHSHNGK